MDVTDKMKMSLDDIIKATTSTRANKRDGKSEVPSKESSKRSAPRLRSVIGAILKGNNRGGITKYRDPRKMNFHKDKRNNIRVYEEDIENFPKSGSGSNISKFNREYNFAKLHISNLDFRTSESDIKELFADTGSVRSVTLNYGRFGRTAEVAFQRREDAIKVVKQYNDVPLNGNPMNIQLAAISVRARLGNVESGPRSRGPAHKFLPRKNNNRGGQSVTPEMLDAELDEYMADKF